MRISQIFNMGIQKHRNKDVKTERLKFESKMPITFAVGVYLSEVPTPPRFLFGVVKQFLGSESGQTHSVILLQNMVSDTTQHPRSPPPPQPLSATHCLYCIYLYFNTGQGRGGGGLIKRRLEGQ
jgi:hypothetical protein